MEISPGINLIHGNSLDVLEAREPESIDLVLTDPPYLMDYKTNHRSKSTEGDAREAALQNRIENDSGLSGRIFVKRYIPLCFRALRDDSAAYFFSKVDGPNGEDLLGYFKKIITDSGFTIANTIVWMKDNWTAGDLEGAYGFMYEVIIFAHKGRPRIRGKRYPDIWQFARVPDPDRVHPHQKPVGLLMRAIEASSDSNGIVFDGCGGSGSTAIAAFQTGRRAIIVENDKERYDLQVDHVRRNTQTRALL